MKKYSRALFIFRRDLRLTDNIALKAAHEQADEVVACFIFDPRQVQEHPYRSLNALQFLVESLEDLAQQMVTLGGRLHVLEGKVEDVLAKIVPTLQCEAVFFNADYTPFSQKRDAALAALSKKMGIACNVFDDATLVSPQEAVKDNGTAYSIFTPFYKKMSQRQVALPARLVASSWYIKPLVGQIKSYAAVLDGYLNEQLAVGGGRTAGKKLLKAAVTHQGEYVKTRDELAGQTTLLSAHHKFGTLSIREVYHALVKAYGQAAPLVRQLYWRDFFTTIAFHYPHVFGHAFNKSYERISWSHNKKLFELWCEGKTGFPLIDAAMRQLNQTGFMHNRARMVVASFLTKDLHIDWRWGEQYFATKLVDYDPAVNNGSWQWAASTGCDAQPYFRVFNPWLQQKKFDPDAQYIYRWLPELKALKPAQIHTLFKPQAVRPAGYPAPLVDHSRESRVSIQMFKMTHEPLSS
jgi:deoxyribodipyrimidine photo-lyase